MESKFMQDVKAFAQTMAERLPKTKEGGIIIMAIDDNDVATCIIANRTHQKDILAKMFEDEGIQQALFELAEENNG